MSGSLFNSDSELLEKVDLQVDETGPEGVVFECSSHFDYWSLGLMWAFSKLTLACALLFGTPIYSGVPLVIFMVVEMIFFALYAGLTTRRLILTHDKLTIITWCSLKLSFPIRSVIEIKSASWKSLSIFNFASAFRNRLFLRRVAGINIIVSPEDPEAFSSALEGILRNEKGSPFAL